MECFGDEFCRGFNEECPSNYDYEADESSTPWFTPWYWANQEDWFDDSLTPYEMGKAWALKVYDDLEAVLKEEEEARESD